MTSLSCYSEDLKWNNLPKLLLFMNRYFTWVQLSQQLLSQVPDRAKPSLIKARDRVTQKSSWFPCLPSWLPFCSGEKGMSRDWNGEQSCSTCFWLCHLLTGDWASLGTPQSCRAKLSEPHLPYFISQVELRVLIHSIRLIHSFILSLIHSTNLKLPTISQNSLNKPH